MPPSAAPTAGCDPARSSRFAFRADAWRGLVRHCESDYPREACGALLAAPALDRDLVTRIEPLRNVACDPLRAFEAEPAAVYSLLLFERRGAFRVLGFYHSHPDANPDPSTRDLALAWPAYWHLIATVRAGRCTETWVGRSAPNGPPAVAASGDERGPRRG